LCFAFGMIDRAAIRGTDPRIHADPPRLLRPPYHAGHPRSSAHYGWSPSPLSRGGMTCLIFIDKCHCLGYICAANLAPVKDAGCRLQLAERVRRLRAAGSSPSLRGSSGISLPALRPAREVHRWKWDRRGEGNSSRTAPSPTKPSLTLSLRDEKSLGREPWWNAGRRARPAGAAPHRKVWRLRNSAFRRSASFFFPRSPGERSDTRSGVRTGMIVPGFRSAHLSYVLGRSDRDELAATAGRV
jgi:hypothetical protein